MGYQRDDQGAHDPTTIAPLSGVRADYTEARVPFFNPQLTGSVGAKVEWTVRRGGGE